MNAAFLRSDRAPDNVLFQVRILDEHFPALDDGLSWPELLTRYTTQQQAAGDFVVLKRAATPREWRLMPLAEKSIGFGEELALPPGTNGPVWAKIEIEPSLAGALVSALFKPPILWLEVETRDGGKERYRLVPAWRAGDFYCSPVIADGGVPPAGGDRLGAGNGQSVRHHPLGGQCHRNDRVLPVTDAGAALSAGFCPTAVAAGARHGTPNPEIAAVDRAYGTGR